jgi:hypothetical protein
MGEFVRALAVATQVRPQVFGRRVAVRRVLREQFERDCFERFRDLRAARSRRHRSLLHMLVRDGDRVLAFERRLADEQLVQHDAERVQVAARIDRTPLCLLG